MRTRSHWIAVLAIGLSLLIATPASAEVKSVSATVRAEGYEPFSALQQKAESLAQEAVSQAFQDSRVTEVSVTVLGDRNGLIAPVLVARITRAQWREMALVSQWSRSLDRTEDLLGFNLPIQQPPVATQPANSSTPDQSGNNPNTNQTPNQAPDSITNQPAETSPRPLRGRGGSIRDRLRQDSGRGGSIRDRLRQDPAYRDD
jgi:hypothetical protein